MVTDLYIGMGRFTPIFVWDHDEHAWFFVSFLDALNGLCTVSKQELAS